MCAEAKPQAVNALRMMQNGVPVRKSKEIFPSNGANVRISVNPNMVWINADSRSGFLFTEKVPAHSGSPHDFIATNKAGFAGINVKKTPPLTGDKVGQWLGSNPPACVTWNGRVVSIDGKSYTVLPVTYGEVVDYAFVKNSYLVIIYDGGIGNVGYKLFNVKALDVALTVNVPVFANSTGIATGMYVDPLMQLVVNKAATKLVIMGVDSSTPASGFPPECTEIPTGIGTGSSKWNSIIRFNIGTITATNESTGGWLTSGTRDNIFTANIYKQVRTATSSEVSVITDSWTLSSTDVNLVGRTNTRSYHQTYDYSNHIHTDQTAVYGLPIKRYVYFDSNDIEQFAVSTPTNTYTYDYYRLEQVVWNFTKVDNQCFDASYALTWFPLSYNDTYSQSITKTETEVSNHSESVAFRSHTFIPTPSSLDKSRPFSSTTTEVCSAARTGAPCNPSGGGGYAGAGDYLNTVDGTNTIDYSSTGDETNYLKNHIISGVKKSILSDVFLGVNQHVDDCTMVYERTKNFVNSTDTAVTVPTSTTTVDIVTDSIRNVYALSVPSPATTTGTHSYAADVSTHTVNSVNLGNVSAGYGYYPRTVTNANTSSSSTTTTFLYINGTEIRDNSAFIQPLSDRYGNMLYTLKNTMVSPNQTGAKALKTGFVLDATTMQSAIAAEVSIPNDVIGVI